MCGLSGQFILQKNIAFDPQQSLNTVKSMNTLMQSRGPDNTSTWQTDLTHQHLILGHNRLSIIDLSQDGTQPMVTQPPQRELALVFNGCIYNYRELRSQLQKLGATFHSTSDTEVILQGWHYWGESTIEKLDGMFAFAIWDAQKNTLFLARDRFGIKPLYYQIGDTSQGKTLIFASTLPAILTANRHNQQSPQQSPQLNPEALHTLYHLHGSIPAPDTIIQGINKLKPAHFLAINAKEDIIEKRYWQLPFKHQHNSTSTPKKSTKDWIAESHQLLYQAVKKRLQAADVPVGILLSGGIDSSLIVAFANEAQKNGDWQNNLHTFSIGFDDINDEIGSEFYYSDQVVNQFQTQHHKYQIPNNQVLQRLPEAIRAMSEPMFGQDCIAFYLLAEQVASNTKVVLSGQGADETFGGYFWYPQIMETDQQHPEYSHYQKIAPHYLDRDHQEWCQMIHPDRHIGDYTQQWIQQTFNTSKTGNLAEDFLATDVSTFIVDDPIKRVDNMTMAWSLEARVPFMDTAVVEHANQIPADIRLANQGKHILKKIAGQWFNHDFIYRKKAYFPMPALKYIQGDFLNLMHDTLTSTQAKQRNLFNPKYIDQLLANPEQHFTRLNGSKLWHAALLEMWLQTHQL